MRRILKSSVLLLLAAVAVEGVSLAVTPGGDDTSNSKSVVKPSDLFPDAVLAKGKGVEVKRSQFDDTLISLKASFAARGQALSPDQAATLEAGVLENLIQMKLLLARASDTDKTMAKDEVDKKFEQIRTNAGSDEILNRQLKAAGMTQGDLLKNWTDDATAKAVLERELKISVSDADVKKYYDENPSKFEQPEMVKVSHILLSTRDMATGGELSPEEKAAKRKQAEALLKRARDGEDFTKLAKDNSEDPSVKQNNGEYTFPRASADSQRGMPPEFELAAFGLKTNEISDIVTTKFGFHIIKLNEKIPASKVELSKVSSRVKDYLVAEQVQKQAPEYVTKLKKDAGIEILDPKLAERVKLLEERQAAESSQSNSSLPSALPK